MGILAEPLRFIRELDLPRGFAVCELGDQWITCVEPHVLAADFYRELGCSRYESIDGNGRGTITADLNRKLPRELWNQFDLVTDFGTGEHIFSQHQVWKSIHDLVKMGGYIVFDRPTQGYPEHCYYNVHECLFHDIVAANEYLLLRIERATTKRGELIRGVFKKQTDGRFRLPQQGRYQKILQV